MDTFIYDKKRDNSKILIRDSLEKLQVISFAKLYLETALKSASSHFAENAKKLLKEIAKDIYAYLSLKKRSTMLLSFFLLITVLGSGFLLVRDSLPQ